MKKSVSNPQLAHVDTMNSVTPTKRSGRRSTLRPAASSVLALILGHAFSAAALAQSAPTSGDVLKQVPAPAKPAATSLPKVGGVDLEPPMQQLPAGGTQVSVRGVKVVGNKAIAAAELENLLLGKWGGAMTLAELNGLATQLTRYYRSKGYFVARAYVPQQQVDGGIVTLRIVEGGYGKFKLTNTSRVQTPRVQATLDEATKAAAISLDSLERAMLIINELPGAQVKQADVVPGAEVGTSDFAVVVEAKPAMNGYVLADNHGSRYTGRERLSFGLDVNSPAGIGDRLSVSGLASTNADLINGRLGYSLPLTANGLRADVAVSKTQYQLGDTFSSLDARGHAQSLEAGLSYPLHKTRELAIDWSLSVAHRDLRDEVRSTSIVTPKTSKSLTAGLSVRSESKMLGYDGATQAALSVTYGELEIKDAAALALDQATGGPKTHGAFGKLNLSVSRTLALSKDLVLTASARGQHALGRNLDASERMALGGVGSVSAYPVGEASSRDAAVVRLELSKDLPAMAGLQHQASVFASWGTGRATSADPSRQISDAGLSWTARHTSGVMVKATVAQRLGDTPRSEPVSKTRLLLQAGWVF